MWPVLKNSDRVYKCCKRQGPPSGKTLKYLEAVPYDCWLVWLNSINLFCTYSCVSGGWYAHHTKISYIVFEVPSNLLLKKMTPRNWQFRIVFSWGIILACHAAVKNKEDFYTARFFLGMMEAGMFSWNCSTALQLVQKWWNVKTNNVDVWFSELLRNCRITSYVWNILHGWAGWDECLAMGISSWRHSHHPVLFYRILHTSWLSKVPTLEQVAHAKGARITRSSTFWERTYSFMIAQILTNLRGYSLS